MVKIFLYGSFLIQNLIEVGAYYLNKFLHSGARVRRGGWVDRLQVQPAAPIHSESNRSSPATEPILRKKNGGGNVFDEGIHFKVTGHSKITTRLFFGF